MEILRVNNLSKIYGSGETEVKALDKISFSVSKGEFVAIVGPSGSGKSTLLHLLGGVDRPTSGQVFIENKDIFQYNDDELSILRRRRIGLVYQFYNLISVLTAQENIILPILLDGKKVESADLDSILHKLHLEDRVNHLPNQLSGGQQQRVAIGRALITKPAIVLADEPTGNLDTENSNQIMELLKSANESFHQTVLLITHSQEIANQANRIITIVDGKIESDERRQS